MPRVVWARQATPTPLGQEFYQQHVIDAVRAEAGPGWQFAEVVSRSLRSSLPGNRRLPAAALARAPDACIRGLGRIFYGRTDLVHRVDVRLPPARREVVTVQDAAPVRFDDEGEIPSFVGPSIARAVSAICVSEFAAREAVDVFGAQHTWVAYAGVSERYFRAPTLTAADREALGVQAPYVLHAGGASKRKNLEALAAAWPEVRAVHPDVELVLVGPPHPERTRLFERVDGVRLLGHVDGQLMPRVFATASAVVVPSTYEGFGMPALEAMAAGTPVVAADCASLPEVVGDAGLLVDPTSAGVGAGLITVIGDSGVSQRLRLAGPQRARRFTWRAAAEVHLRAYAEALGL